MESGRGGSHPPIPVLSGPHRVSELPQGLHVKNTEAGSGAGAMAAQVVCQHREGVGTCAPCGREGLAGCSSVMEWPGHS